MICLAPQESSAGSCSINDIRYDLASRIRRDLVSHINMPTKQIIFNCQKPVSPDTGFLILAKH